LIWLAVLLPWPNQGHTHFWVIHKIRGYAAHPLSPPTAQRHPLAVRPCAPTLAHDARITEFERILVVLHVRFWPKALVAERVSERESAHRERGFESCACAVENGFSPSVRKRRAAYSRAALLFPGGRRAEGRWAVVATGTWKRGKRSASSTAAKYGQNARAALVFLGYEFARFLISTHGRKNGWCSYGQWAVVGGWCTVWCVYAPPSYL